MFGRMRAQDLCLRNANSSELKEEVEEPKEDLGGMPRKIRRKPKCNTTFWKPREELHSKEGLILFMVVQIMAPISP